MRLAILFFLFGILLFQHFSKLPSLYWLLGALLLPLVRWRSFRLPVAFLAGFLWAFLHAIWTLGHLLPQELEGIDVELTGVIASLVEEDAHRSRFHFSVDKLLHEGQHLPAPRRVLLSWYGRERPTLVVGDRWQLTVRLKRPHGFMNPGGFNYEKWLFQQGINAVGYVRPKGAHTHLASEWHSRPLDRLRRQLREQMREWLGEHPQAGLITALTIGERHGIQHEQWQTLTATGTNHLMAISGLHVGLVAGFAFFLGRRLWSLLGPAPLLLAAPRAAAFMALLTACGYAALAGFSIPTQRAVIMVAVVMGAIFLQRQASPGQALCIALLGVLLWDPTAVVSAGFWLSFTAVAIILYGLGGRVGKQQGWKGWGQVQWVVTLGLLPLLILFFQQAPLTAPLANLIAVPWVSITVVPLALLGAALLPLYAPLGGWLLLQAANLLGWLWPLLEWLAGLKLLLWQPPAPAEIWTLLPASLGILWLLAPRGIPARWIGICGLLPLVMNAPQRPAAEETWFTLLDVGQGLAAVVQTRNHTLVYDTGPRFSDRFDTGAAVLIPFLRWQGIRSLDMLIIGHGDNDHIGGAPSLLREYPAKRLLSAVPEKLEAKAEPCRQGESWSWDGVRFTLLHPPSEYGGSGNDASCVLKVETPGASLLLTGDIERRAEQQLLQTVPERLRAELLVAPHHGSKSSSSPHFIDAVDPEYVLFPVGYRNRYNHPHSMVMERYATREIQLLDTASNGAIHFRLGRQGLSPPQSYRIVAHRYWNIP